MRRASTCLSSSLRTLSRTRHPINLGSRLQVPAASFSSTGYNLRKPGDNDTMSGKEPHLHSTRTGSIDENYQDDAAQSIRSMVFDSGPDPMLDAYQQALSKNTKWAQKTAAEQPALFPKLATGQHPEILWIGCADSRCPETTVLGLQPGDIFVHRNIANIVQHTDISAASVIEFAVVYLKVKHIVLCGHTSCGGISASLANTKLGLLDTWLMPLRQLRLQNLELLNKLGPVEASNKLAELNIHHGLRVLKENSVVIDAIKERGLKIHGVIYDVGCGELRELDSDEPLETITSRLEVFKTLAKG